MTSKVVTVTTFHRTNSGEDQQAVKFADIGKFAFVVLAESANSTRGEVLTVSKVKLITVNSLPMTATVAATLYGAKNADSQHRKHFNCGNLKQLGKMLSCCVG